MSDFGIKPVRPRRRAHTEGAVWLAVRMRVFYGARVRALSSTRMVFACGCRAFAAFSTTMGDQACKRHRPKRRCIDCDAIEPRDLSPCFATNDLHITRRHAAGRNV